MSLYVVMKLRALVRSAANHSVVSLMAFVPFDSHEADDKDARDGERVCRDERSSPDLDRGVRE
jgi:hypothetical protein